MSRFIPRIALNILLTCALLLTSLPTIFTPQKIRAQNSSPDFDFTHLTTADNDLPIPSSSVQQTASLILDIDKDGVNDFVIASRRPPPGPSLVWYRRTIDDWERYVIDSEPLDIEAGGDYWDIDGGGDLDIVMGGDSRSNQIWWWENPAPNFSPNTEWTRRLIKNSGGNKHHDQIFGDFTGDGKVELAFWNQYAGLSNGQVRIIE
ncbi:MAG: VCBS repeat-containing protein [Caldilineaceae bacterium]|nr:VCBS repeat-containing protein [Caldilineaceae bacterium]